MTAVSPAVFSIWLLTRSDGSELRIVVALAGFASRKFPRPPDPYLWLCSGARESWDRAGFAILAAGRGPGLAHPSGRITRPSRDCPRDQPRRLAGLERSLGQLNQRAAAAASGLCRT